MAVMLAKVTIFIAGQPVQITVAVIVSACALGFTIGSFWWINARRGTLRSYSPYSFAATKQGDDIRIRLPLLFLATGARPIVIQDLRLRVWLGERKWFRRTSILVPWYSTSSHIQPKGTDRHDLPAIFAVQGRATEVVFAEFGLPTSEFDLQAIDYQVRVEAKLADRRWWTSVARFPLRLSQTKNKLGNYLSHSNSPTPWPFGAGEA